MINPYEPPDADDEETESVIQDQLNREVGWRRGFSAAGLLVLIVVLIDVIGVGMAHLIPWLNEWHAE